MITIPYDAQNKCSFIPSMLREFLSPALQQLDESSLQFLKSERRERLKDTVLAELSAALPHIRANIGNDYLPTPPAFLELDDLEISVRTYNCLLNIGIKNDIQLIGALTINDLLSTRNFGVKSLVDLLCALEVVDPNAVLQKRKREQQRINLDSVISLEDIETIYECVRQQTHLPKYIRSKRLPELPKSLCLEELDLKKRTHTALSRKGFIKQPQKLSNTTIESLLALPSFGKDSLLDLLIALEPYFHSTQGDEEREVALAQEFVSEATLLAEMPSAELISIKDLRFGKLLRSIFPTSTSTREAAEMLLEGENAPLNPKILTEQIRQFRKQVEEFSQMKLEDELRSMIVKAPSSRNLEIFIKRHGLNGDEELTLQQLGDEYALERERIRQICRPIEESFRDQYPYAPALDKALDMVLGNLPNTADEIEVMLKDKGISKTSFRLESLQNAARLLGREVSFNITEVGGQRIVSTRDLEFPVKKILSIARRAIEHWGATTVEEISTKVTQESSLSSDLVFRVITKQEDFRWLDQENGWFWFESVPRNRLLNQIEKVLSVAKEIDIAELRDGVRRHHRMEGFAPPQRVILEFCRQHNDYKVEGRTISITSPMDWRKKLAETEQTMVEILLNNGSVMRREDFETECLARGMVRATFYVYLDYSPIIARYARGVYGLRGASIPPGLIESIKPKIMRGEVLKDYGWTQEGEIWIGYKLSESTILNGVCTMPAALARFIGEEFCLKFNDGSIVGNLATKSGSVWGVGPMLRRKGAEAGDYMVLVFNIASRTATVNLGDESLLEKFQSTNTENNVGELSGDSTNVK